MSGALGNLLIKLTADTGEATGEIGKAAHQVERDMAAMSRNATAAGMLIAEAIGNIAGSFAQAAKDAINFGDTLSKMSQKSSFAVERLSEITFAAELSDVSVGTLNTALGMFNKVLSDSAKEGSKAAAVFSALGVDVTQGPQVAFDQFAKAINSLPDGETKVATMRAVFGRAGDALIPMMKGLDDASEKARQLGLVISKQMAEDSEKFNDNMKMIGVSMRALGLTAMQPLVGWLSQISDAMVKAKINGNSLQVGILEMGKTWAALWGGMAESVGAGRLAKVMESEFHRLDAAVKKMTIATGTGSGAAASTASGANTPGETNAEMLACIYSGGNWVGGKCVQKSEDKTKKAKDDSAWLANQYKRMAEERAKEMREATDANNQAGDALEERARLEMKWGEEFTNMTLQEIQEWEKRKFAAIDAMNEITEANTRMANGFDENSKKIGDSTKKNSDWAREMGVTFNSAFEDAIISGKKLSEVVRGLGQDIARTVARKMIVNPLADALSAGVGSLIQGFFRADGGPVSGGQPYIVGERGPELFVPGMSGAIVPNDSLSAATGAGVTVIQHNTFGSDVNSSTLRIWAETIKDQTMSAIIDNRNRAGDFSRM